MVGKIKSIFQICKQRKIREILYNLQPICQQDKILLGKYYFPTYRISWNECHNFQKEYLEKG